eukprot:6180922-Pleurochrysis_carterae.AAC.2
MPTPIPQALLSDNATRYERFRALPNDNTLHIMWTGWAIVTFVSASASALIIVGIMTAPAVRSNVLNIYLVALVFPDFLFSFCCGITCTINAAAPQLGINHVPWMCELQSVYCIFGFVASPWMNAVVGYEVCRLLHANRWALTYMAPTIKVALRNAALVYLWALFVATWTLIPGLPHNANPIGGMACLPVEYDTASSVFFWLLAVLEGGRTAASFACTLAGGVLSEDPFDISPVLGAYNCDGLHGSLVCLGRLGGRHVEPPAGALLCAPLLDQERRAGGRSPTASRRPRARVLLLWCRCTSPRPADPGRSRGCRSSDTTQHRKQVFSPFGQLARTDISTTGNAQHQCHDAGIHN